MTVKRFSFIDEPWKPTFFFRAFRGEIVSARRANKFIRAERWGRPSTLSPNNSYFRTLQIRPTRTLVYPASSLLQAGSVKTQDFVFFSSSSPAMERVSVDAD